MNNALKTESWYFNPRYRMLNGYQMLQDNLFFGVDGFSYMYGGSTNYI